MYDLLRASHGIHSTMTVAATTTGMKGGELGSSAPILVKPLRNPSGGLAAGLSGEIPGSCQGVNESSYESILVEEMSGLGI